MAASEDPSSEMAFFETIPWCRAILADPDYSITSTYSRRCNSATGENRLLAQTLKTTDTVAAWCSLYRRPNRATGFLKTEALALIALNQGVDGYPHVCHGGVTATLLDEVMTILVSVCRISEGEKVVKNVTADLRVKYVRPVNTPGVVLVSARVKDVQKGRKYFVTGEVMDGQRTVLAQAEGLFIMVDRERL